MVVVKKKVALTPPLGWNSWNCFGADVSAKGIKQQAKALVDLGLKDLGYTYVNIDDGWQGERGGKYKALQANEKFPDMPGLCDYIHKLGLKIGIYSTPWTRSYGGYTGSGKNIKNDIKEWAEWGIDFIKYDWSMSSSIDKSIDYLKEISEAIDDSDREIVLSLSNAAPIEKGEIWAKYANMWRTTTNLMDSWKRLVNIGFGQSGWEKFAGPGHWNDPDMMVLGNFRGKPTRLTEDEQITHFSLWSMLAAPIILGCDLTQVDDQLLAIIGNKEVLEVNQDRLGIQGKKIKAKGDVEIWKKELNNNKQAIAFFNKGDKSAKLTIKLADIGFSKKVKVRDLWLDQDLGDIFGELSVEIVPHGTKMFVFS